MDSLEELNSYLANDDIQTNSTICNCGKNIFIDDASIGMRICKSCGQAQDILLDMTPEWRFNEEDSNNNSRCNINTNVLLPQSSLCSPFMGTGRLKMIHKWNAMPYKERSLNNIFKILHNKCVDDKIPKKIEDDAKIMYKLVSESKHASGKNIGKYIITRGINRDSIIAASLFYACRRNNMTRSPKEIAKLFSISETDLNRGAKNFIKLKMAKNEDMGTSNISHFIKRKCDQLHIINDFADKAINISSNITKLNIASDHTTYSLAAASILLLNEQYNIETITKKSVAEIFNISEVTISKTLKKIEQYKNLIFDDILTNKIYERIEKYKSNKTIPPSVLEKMHEFSIDVKSVDNCVTFEEIINKIKSFDANNSSIIDLKLLFLEIDLFFMQ